jgi:hypothetical protein
MDTCDYRDFTAGHESPLPLLRPILRGYLVPYPGFRVIRKRTMIVPGPIATWRQTPGCGVLIAHSEHQSFKDLIFRNFFR